MTRMRVGLVGCGNIAADMCIQLRKGTIPADIVALTDVDRSHAEKIQSTFQLDAAICDLDENASQVDYIVECAGGDAVPDVIGAAIRHNCDCLIMSVGGLLAHPNLMEEARDRIHVQVPSGALVGLDGIRAAIEAGLHRVVLTTRKPPKGLEGAPYLEEQGIDLSTITEPTVIFEGNALDAVKAFPKNVNVAASLSIVGVGPKETTVRVICDPTISMNTHEVLAEGAFGSLRTISENLPSPRNAKSSYLASLSAVAELRVAATAFCAHNKPEVAG